MLTLPSSEVVLPVLSLKFVFSASAATSADYFVRRALATCSAVTSGAALPQELRM